jgi:hypothetical protein
VTFLYAHWKLVWQQPPVFSCKDILIPSLVQPRADPGLSVIGKNYSFIFSRGETFCCHSVTVFPLSIFLVEILYSSAETF